jgi:hypothetical protein
MFVQLVFLDIHNVILIIFKFSTMCSRSERRVVQLAAWTNATWRPAFIRVHTLHWPVVLRVVWHHCLTFCESILSLFCVLLSNVTVTGKLIRSWLAVLQTDAESRTFAWPVRPLHTHWFNILSHLSVTEINKMQTLGKVDTQFVFTRDRTPKLTMWLSIPPVMREPSPYLRPYPIWIW